MRGIRGRAAPLEAQTGRGRSDEGSGQLVARNTLVNVAGRFLNVALAIAITPFLLDRLGAADYGIWLLAMGLTFTGGYLMIAELGFMQVVVRHVARCRASSDLAGASAIASTAVVAYAALGAVLAVLLIALAGPLTSAFSIPTDRADVARQVFAIVGFQIFLDLPAASVMSVLEAGQRYGTLRLIDAIARVAWFAGSIAVVWAGHSVVAIAAVSLGASILTLLGSWVAARTLEPGVRISPRRCDLRALKRLGLEAPPMLLLRVLSIVYSQMDRVIIGVMVSAAAVTDYEIAFKIHSVAALVLGVAPSAVMPAAAYLSAGGQAERLQQLFLRGTRYASAACIMLCATTIIYTPFLIRSWVGSEFVRMTAATRLFLLYPAIAVLFAIGQTILIGRGELRDLVRLQALSVGVNLVASIALVHVWGVTGAIVGTLAGSVVLLVGGSRVLLARFQVTTVRLAREVVAPLLPVIAVQGVAGLVTAPLLDRSGLLAVVAVFGLNLTVGVAAYVALMPRSERKSLRQMLSPQRSGSIG